MLPLSRFIKCASSAELLLTDRQKAVYQSLLGDNLQHSRQNVQAQVLPATLSFLASREMLCRSLTAMSNLPRLQATVAFGAFFRHYYNQAGSSSDVVEQYRTGLQAENPVIRRGSALALGATPKNLLQPCARQVLSSLAAATKVLSCVIDSKTLGSF